jgi:Protein of unknown function (DUF3866)
MALELAWGIVTAVSDVHTDVIRLEVDGRPAIAYPRLLGSIEVGDSVVVNRPAHGADADGPDEGVVAVNLTRGLRLRADPAATISPLPFTPWQGALRFAEEEAELPDRIDGLPVICCGQHAQVGPAAVALAGRHVAYVQTIGGALPVSVSDTVRSLRERGLLGLVIAAAPCFDGDLQCASLPSALAVAKTRGAEVVICAPGPGLVETSTTFGHGGVVAADAANAASALGGRPILAPRLRRATAHEGGDGLIPQTRAALALCLGNVRVAWPEGIDGPGGVEVARIAVEGWEEACAGLPDPLPRSVEAGDPSFISAAYAAGALAASLLA